ncbi:unnamed protein product [marine sediment metagenome]|uniref:Uncharacterized protein n=1 Tax=marine sediment metagenome TaxID=412755 RepID=X0VD24_9ZZZZ
MEAHERGIKTWVSVEPVVDPVEALMVIETLLPYVDLWKVGKLNHDPEREKAINWKNFLMKVERLLQDRPHIIKNDLLEAAGVGGQRG